MAIRGPEQPGASPVSAVVPPCHEAGTAGAAARIVFRDVPLAMLMAVAAAALLTGSGWTAMAGPWPWILSLALVGLPHGAADFAIARELFQPGTGSLALAITAYGVGMAIVAAVFAVAPLLTIAAFSLVSIWHFGSGHLETEPYRNAAASGRPCPLTGAWRGIAAIARAGFVLGVPAVRWPVETAAVADRLVALVRGAGGSNDTMFDPDTIRAGGWVFVAASLASLAAETIHCRGRGFLWTAAEITVFALLAFASDPLFSVGLYFLLWHAWRHIGALVPVLVAGDPRGGFSLPRAVATIHRKALPLLLPTWGALAAAWWLLSPEHSARDLAILSIGVYLVVTPSHDLLVHRLVAAESADVSRRRQPNERPRRTRPRTPDGSSP